MSTSNANDTGQGVIPLPAPLSPYLTVSDAKKAIEFYQRGFGAELQYRNDTPDGKKVVHAQLRLPNGGVFMLCDEFPEMGAGRAPTGQGGTGVTLHIDLPDVDATWKRAIDAGAQETMPLADQFWGDRYGKIRDPFGHQWSLATRKRAVSQAEAEEAARKYFPPR
jgi:PhnB protein